jgi:hypothetical protein
MIAAMPASDDQHATPTTRAAGQRSSRSDTRSGAASGESSVSNGLNASANGNGDAVAEGVCSAEVVAVRAELAVAVGEAETVGW